jgi:hypothetical protein
MLTVSFGKQPGIVQHGYKVPLCPNTETQVNDTLSIFFNKKVSRLRKYLFVGEARVQTNAKEGHLIDCAMKLNGSFGAIQAATHIDYKGSKGFHGTIVLWEFPSSEIAKELEGWLDKNLNNLTGECYYKNPYFFLRRDNGIFFFETFKEEDRKNLEQIVLHFRE